MKVLCTGDVHIGRRSSRLRADADGHTISTAACWSRIVELALAERVDVVALSGDVVDQANRYYEAIGPLEAGIQRLADAGITTVAVAGNHDHDVLPWLADSMGSEAFRLLGRSGEWERTTIRKENDVLHIDGWSFPSSSFTDSPLRSYHLPPSGDGVVLGLLHADLEQPRSPYAPVSLAELRARQQVHLWLLGHVHGARVEDAPGQASVLYPGSPQAMDPGEPGVHGVWILDVGAGGTFDRRLVPLSTVWYETVEVDLTGVEEQHRADQMVVDAVRGSLNEIVLASGPLAYLSCRITVTGRTPLHRTLGASLERQCADLELASGAVRAWVDWVRVATRPAVDLGDLARGRDAVGVLAGLILDLERVADSGQIEGETARLVRDAREDAAAKRRAKPYMVLDDVDLDDAEVAGALAEQATLLLEELLSQKAE